MPLTYAQIQKIDPAMTDIKHMQENGAGHTSFEYVGLFRNFVYQCETCRQFVFSLEEPDEIT